MCAYVSGHTKRLTLISASVFGLRSNARQCESSKWKWNSRKRGVVTDGDLSLLRVFHTNPITLLFVRRDIFSCQCDNQTKTARQSRKIKIEKCKKRIKRQNGNESANRMGETRGDRTSETTLTIALYHSEFIRVECRVSSFRLRTKREHHEHSSLFRPQIERVKNYFRFVRASQN